MSPSLCFIDEEAKRLEKTLVRVAVKPRHWCHAALHTQLLPKSEAVSEYQSFKTYSYHVALFKRRMIFYCVWKGATG